MTQTFNIKRFGQCLKLRFLDPMMLRYALLAAAMLAPMIAVSISLGTMTMAGLMSCGIPAFFGIVMVTNKIIDAMLPATAAEKFLSWVVAATVLTCLFFGIVSLTGLFFVDGGGQNPMPDIAAWRFWLSGYAGCAALVLIGNLQWMTQNIMIIGMIPCFALIAINFLPCALASGAAWAIILSALTAALWIGAYLTYRHRIVKNN
ncbi:MAG: hypothetical protein J6T12_09555 [Salinivirgaceae bacterium]|nr:hypothetical protein [Salinivirgaceae bacterium]